MVEANFSTVWHSFGFVIFFSLVVHEHFISFLFYFKDKTNSKTFSTGMFISCCSICYSRFQIEYFWKYILFCIQMKIAIHLLWMFWYKIAIYGRVVYNKLGMIFCCLINIYMMLHYSKRCSIEWQTFLAIIWIASRVFNICLWF